MIFKLLKINFKQIKLLKEKNLYCNSNAIRSIILQSSFSGKDNRRWEQKIESIKIYEAFVEDNQSIIDS